MKKKDNRKRVLRFCEFCKKEFYPFEHNVKRGWGKFCGYACRQHSYKGKLHRSEEFKKKMSESRKKENNPNWKGNDAKIQTGRLRARRWFGKAPCEICGKEKTDIHHIDGNTFNNNISNLKHLCRKHHQEIDGRLEKRTNQLIEINKSKKINKLFPSVLK